MLWVAFCAVCSGVLRVTGIGFVHASILTSWLVVILISRLCWGKRGGLVVVFLTAFVGGCMTMWNNHEGLPPLMLIVASCFDGFAFGVCGFVANFFLDLLVYLVNWLDTRGRKSEPPDS